MKDSVTMTLLYDYYGELLTAKQRCCFDLYYNQDYSLAEIAAEEGISRQGVHDSIARAEGLRLPPLCDNTAQFEGVDLGIGKRLPWVAGGLDQSMALLGQRCIAPHTAKVTYGTCCACWMNMGDEVVLDDHLTTSVAWKAGQSPVYALAAEGGAAGSIVTWLQRNFKPEWKTGQLSNLARECGEDSAVVFVPAFNGLGAPYWDAAARGTLFGVTAGTAPAHILRAGLDAVAYTLRISFTV